MGDDTRERRHELGLFLRARRQRTAPEDIGLPGSGRRRTPGLRREELAAAAGISTTWYTFLEQGRDVRASDQVLTAIANALRLDDAERAHLVAISTDDRVDTRDFEYLAPEVADVPGLMEPNPAYVTGSSYDLLAGDRAASELFPGAFEVQRPNLARWVFTDPVARDVLVDWADVAQGLLARLRANAGRHPGSSRFAQLERELRTGSAEADAWWPRYDIAASRHGVKRVRTPSGEERTLAHVSFQVADQPEQILTVYRDAEQRTAAPRPGPAQPTA
jgi:transcriptional regulator with XRE-family HTH domain